MSSLDLEYNPTDSTRIASSTFEGVALGCANWKGIYTWTTLGACQCSSSFVKHLWAKTSIDIHHHISSILVKYMQFKHLSSLVFSHCQITCTKVVIIKNLPRIRKENENVNHEIVICNTDCKTLSTHKITLIIREKPSKITTNTKQN